MFEHMQKAQINHVIKFTRKDKKRPQAYTPQSN